MTRLPRLSATSSATARLTYTRAPLFGGGAFIAAAADTATAARLKQAFEQRVLELNEQIEKQKRHEQECVAQPLAARAHCVTLTLTLTLVVVQVRAVAEGEGT